MNHLPFRLQTYVALAIVLSIEGAAHAQTPGDTVYFDPNLTMTQDSGGTGDFSTSPFLDPMISDEPFMSGTTPVIVAGSPNTTTVTLGQAAVFNGPGSMVSVSAPVNPYSLQVGVTSGTETFGTAGAAAQISFPVGNGVGLNPININSSSAPGTEDVVFNSGVNLDIAQPSYNGYAVNSYSSGNLAFNGGITFSNYTTDSDDAGIPSLVITNNVAGGSITINSAVAAVNAPGSVPIHNAPVINLNSAGTTTTLTSNASFANVVVGAHAGTVLDQGASYSGNNVGYGINVGGTGQYLTDTAGVNVSEGIVFSNGGGTIGGALAAETTYSAYEIVGYNGTTVNLTSAAGGRVDFTGDVHSGQGNAIVKIGAGTIALNDVQGRAEDQTGGWEIQNGTMLVNGSDSNKINNGNNNGTSLSGSGVQIDQVATSALAPNVQTYATLGGTGDTSVAVTAVGANSSITPGDPKFNNGIGTLTLTGGLTATNGITFNIGLDGAIANGLSTVAFNGSNLTLGGTVTFNFTNVGGALDTNTPYNVLTNFSPNATGGSTLDTAAFVLNAPVGYLATLDPTDLLPGATSFAVDFTAASVPEPSTWALIGLGGLILIGSGKFRKLRA